MRIETTMQQHLFTQLLHINLEAFNFLSNTKFCSPVQEPHVTAKTISSSRSHPERSASLLQDGQLPRLKEGLDHPHGKDVHFGVHNDFFFLHQLCRGRTKKKKNKSDSEKKRVFGDGHREKNLTPHRLFSSGIRQEAKEQLQRTLKRG